MSDKLTAPWLNEAHAPESVKQRIAERLSQKTPRSRWLRPSLAAGALAALGVGGLVVAPLILRPSLAFAQVESALTKVKLVQWRETYSSYATDGALYERLVTDHYARFSPVAWDTRPRPELTYVDGKKYFDDVIDRRLRTLQETLYYNALTKTFRRVAGDDPALAPLPGSIYAEIFAPGGRTSVARDGWSTRSATWKNKRVVQLERHAPPSAFGGAVTQVLLVDPETRRILRSSTRQEPGEPDPNGAETTERILEDFRYDGDVQLPGDAFTLEPPPGTRILESQR
jgi:hypothetical protein